MKLFLQPALFFLALISLFPADAQVLATSKIHSRQDTLRGSITPNRAWWDVSWYGITVKPDITQKTIAGTVLLDFRVLENGQTMQLDMQMPMEINSVKWKNSTLTISRDSNIYLVSFPSILTKGSKERLSISFSGKPREARNPPWDGGWIWKKDRNGSPWVSVACQGLGASVWFPCKDHQSDEPDSASLTMIIPDTLVAVGNGRMRSQVHNGDHTITSTWAVTNPISNYTIIPYIGKYVHWGEVYQGEAGKLDCDYWVLNYNLDSAKLQFTQATQMLKAFEFWFGPYPFYSDGYKLIEAPHLGMEHQSAVAYGNHFRNGYLGRDLSGSGWGLKWDFIIVHESGHEWFGNNITSKDIADMWVHEGFTNYSETLFTDFYYGNEAGDDYLVGSRRTITNRTPITGPYGVNEEGSGDMYSKGGSMLHTIRQVINNDTLFRKILRGLNSTFYHKTVTAREIEAYINKQSGIDFSKVFDQYLLRTEIPELAYKANGKKLEFRWTKVVDGFALPVKYHAGIDGWLKPTTVWNSVEMPAGFDISKFQVDRNFYVTAVKQ